MNTEITVSIDLAEYIRECIEAVRDEGYFVFRDEEEARDFFGESDLLVKIKETIGEMRTKVIYEPDSVSQDYKELYEKLDRALFYE